MSQPAVSQEVLSHCNKCKLALAHIILVMKDDGKIGRCQCKTCGAKHVYKDPDAVKKKTTRKRKIKAPEIPIEEVWKDALSKAVGDPKQYNIKGEFFNGEVINHPTFGQGVVDKQLDGDKIHVIFETDIKTLVQNR